MSGICWATPHRWGCAAFGRPPNFAATFMEDGCSAERIILKTLANMYGLLVHLYTVSPVNIYRFWILRFPDPRALINWSGPQFLRNCPTSLRKIVEGKIDDTGERSVLIKIGIGVGPLRRAQGVGRFCNVEILKHTYCVSLYSDFAHFCNTGYSTSCNMYIAHRIGAFDILGISLPSIINTLVSFTSLYIIPKSFVGLDCDGFYMCRVLIALAIIMDLYRIRSCKACNSWWLKAHGLGLVWATLETCFVVELFFMLRPQGFKILEMAYRS